MHGKGREPTLPEPKRTRTSAWKKLWPKSDVECDFEESETVSEESVLNEIVSLTKVMGQEMNTNDIHELLEEHNQELTTEELMDLQCVSQQEAVKESLLEKEEVIVMQQSSSAIREMLKAWKTVASYIEKHHPNKAVAMRATNLFNDYDASHFRKHFEESAKTNVSRQRSINKILCMYQNSYKSSTSLSKH
ncbi:hypothetical protein AVEN_238786-1 [Araneus ventricosus]|uniref:Uncharacterized protein n=1 Tax=Araneus ventricosus TaxID=182803 RepID=A0A4Y2IYY0_ARAVE|nr:hypothetical protein AVEN_238786-1 [Araneus ventricosus]